MDKTKVCSRAAKGGHFDVLKWARENGCPWDSNTCIMAIAARRTDILTWARANGCPLEEFIAAMLADEDAL